MKKIILLPANTDFNRGDQALVWESVRVIQDVFKDEAYDIKLVLSSKREIEMNGIAQTQKKLNLGYIDSILKHPNRFFIKHAEQKVNYGKFGYFLFGIVAIFDFIKSLFLLVPVRVINQVGLLFYSDEAKKSFNAIKEADSVFVKGGGFLHSYGSPSDFYRLYYIVYLVLLSIRFKKKIFIFPNSIGPLKNKLASSLVKYTLKRCRFITVRESISYNFVKEKLGLPVGQFMDFGYHLKENKAFDPVQYMRKKVATTKPIVGITLRPDRTLTEGGKQNKYLRYIDSFVKLVKYLNNEGYYVCFFAHTLGPSANENDELAIRDVISSLDAKAEYSYIVDKTLSCEETMMLYSQCKFFIGTRFHSVIFAQNMGIPTIAISYGGNKGDGIMGDLKLNDFVIKMEDVSGDKIISIFNNLVSSQEKYREILRNHRSEVEKNRNQLITEIKKYV